MKWLEEFIDHVADRILDTICLEDEDPEETEMDPAEMDSSREGDTVVIADEDGRSRTYRVAATFTHEDDSKYIFALPAEESMLERISLFRVEPAENNTVNYVSIEDEDLKGSMVCSLSQLHDHEIKDELKETITSRTGWGLFAVIVFLISFFGKVSGVSWSFQIPAVRTDIVLAVFVVSAVFLGRWNPLQNAGTDALKTIVTILQMFAITFLTVSFPFYVTAVWMFLYLSAFIITARIYAVPFYWIIPQVFNAAVMTAYIAYLKFVSHELLMSTHSPDSLTFVCMAASIAIASVLIILNYRRIYVNQI